MSRVLLEFNGMRVDLKDPISSRQGKRDDEGRLAELIDDALSLVTPKPQVKGKRK